MAFALTSSPARTRMTVVLLSSMRLKNVCPTVMPSVERMSARLDVEDVDRELSVMLRSERFQDLDRLVVALVVSVWQRQVRR
jgi:hypothetical protein